FTVANAAMAPDNGFISRAVVIGATTDDQIDFSQTSLPIVALGGGGHDRISGSQSRDLLFGGGGSAEVYGNDGADEILTFGGALNTLVGGAGDDFMFASGAGDSLTGGAGRDEFVIGNGDWIGDRASEDYVSSFQARVAQRLQARLDRNRAAVANVPPAVRPPDAPANRSAPNFTLTVSDTTVAHGESFVATVQPLAGQTGSWARLELYLDQNGNGRYDRDTDFFVAQYRGRTAGWRAQLAASQFPVGTHNLYARLLSYDGTITQNASPIQLTILGPQPGPSLPLLPDSFDIVPEDAQVLVPHRNGDVTYPGQSLNGAGQLDIYSITPHTGGNFHIWTAGDTDTVLALYDASGNIVAGPDDDSGPGANGDLLVALDADKTYYFVVAGKNGATGAYDLHMTGRNQDVTATIDTPAGAYSGSVTATMTEDHRLDYFQLVAPAGATSLDVSVTPPVSGALWVRVADSAGNVIGSGEPGRSGAASLLDRLPVDGGATYYVTVYALYGTVGDYAVAADFSPDQLGLPDTVDYPNLKPFTPLVIQGDGDGELPNEVISSSSELRYYLLSPSMNGQSFVIQTTGGTDVQLALYDGSGQQRIAWDDNSADGVNGRLDVTLDQRGDYWIVVRGAGATTGPFGLTVSGSDQTQAPILIGGLQNLGERFTWIVNNERQSYGYFVAPTNATSVDVQLAPYGASQVDAWLSIESPDGEVTSQNVGGPGQSETILSYPVVGGATYRITAYGWNMTVGGATIYVDASPDLLSGGEFAINTTTPGDQRNVAVAMNSAGDSVVVWRQFASGEFDYDLRGQRFDSLGRPVGTEFPVNPPDDVDQSYPHVAMDDSGRFVVVWNDGYGRVFDSTGTGGAVFNVGFQAWAVVMQDDGRFLVLGGDYKQIWVKPYNANGTASGPQVTIDSAYTAYEARLAADGNGGYVAAWNRQGVSRDPDVPYFRRLDATGSPATALARVATDISAYHSVESVSVTPTGTLAFAVRQNTTLSIARFQPDNSPIGARTIVNTRPIDSWPSASVQQKDNGEFVVLWSMLNEANTNRDVYFRQYDSNGAPATAAELQANSYVANDQWFPALAGNGGERFFATWQSMNQDGSGDGIFGRFLTLPTPTPTPLFAATDNSGATDDAKIDVGEVRQNATGPSAVVHVTNIGSAILTGTLSLGGAGASA
ncbi:MAG TPA: hypothetical protein PLV92_09415, partial [Pirellulaceae bacterium]|nr:hypothetical protein [Pirellulaceae bacterium]